MSEKNTSQKETLYPEINIKALNQAANMIWLLAGRQTSGIEIIGEKVERVRLYSRDLNESIRDSLAQLTPILSQFAEGETFQTISQIDEALAAPDLSDDDRNALLEERNQLIGKLSKDIDNVIINFSGKTSQLTGKINDISNMVIVERLGDLVAQAESKKAELQSEIESKAEKRKKLDEYRAKIIESQDVIRANNIADMFKDFIPSASDIDGLDFTQPKKEAIKQAIKQGVEIARKILGQISEGLKYSELADARMKLTDQIDQVMKETDVLKTTLQETEQRISGLKDVVQIDTERTVLLSEAVKLEQAWNEFATQLHSLSGNKVDQKNLTNLINGQLDFLKNLAEQYNKLK
ncbi:alpha-xenorhabdolysin family binary toxin subunit B [Xenorhabdus khoisanae]|uniref:alpha-xenorhabdolysin family binary toxin subunit B n=1 Tax=Xenorhabdus khoisanae TaxID=880157 RepID=UPI002359B915|nr:alpha-xenorhabdolysin family binary toxin subunit B [Xenorhabdus khoisanae]MDC9613460.1 alpha-xenorhabdolysin family binary toxin subunit B [Xenorhabdus khoisanae]